MTPPRHNHADDARAAFAEHVIVNGSADNCRWLLQRPGGDSAFSTEIICGQHRDLIVTGDIDIVAFQFGPHAPEARVRWMGERRIGWERAGGAGYHFDGYVAEKASIGTGSAVVFTFDPAAARDDILSWMDDVESPQALSDLVDHIYGASAREEVQQMLLDEMGSEFMSDRWDVGMTLAPRVYLAHAALARLCALFDARDKAIATGATHA